MKNRLPDLNVPARERIGWVDLLRVIACFLVVFSHSCDAFVAVFDSDRATFLQGALAGSFVRACVPLFVMMSGVLLLPVRTGTGAFYRKRIGRVLLALVFWSLTLPVLYYLYMRYVGTSSPSIDPALFTGEATLHKMLDLRLQLLLRHHAALVSLYADRTLSDHAADQPVARTGLAARVAERPRDLGRDAAAALREDAGPGARLHGQLRQHGALRRLRLERVRHVPLRLGLRRLPRTGLLPREIPARMELAQDIGHLHPDLPRRIPRHGAGLRGDAETFSGQLRLPRNRLVFRRHQRLYDDRARSSSSCRRPPHGPAHGSRGWRARRSASTSATSSSFRPATTSCSGFRDFPRWRASR